jgi:hypothetical protein
MKKQAIPLIVFFLAEIAIKNILIWALQNAHGFIHRMLFFEDIHFYQTVPTTDSNERMSAWFKLHPHKVCRFDPFAYRYISIFRR